MSFGNSHSKSLLVTTSKQIRESQRESTTPVIEERSERHTTRVQEFSGTAAHRDEVSPDMESMQEFEDLERFYDYPKDVRNFTMRRSETMKKDTPSQDGSQASQRK